MIKAYWSPKIAEFLELKRAIATLEALSRVYVQFAWELECVRNTVDAYTGNTANTATQKQSKHSKQASTANAQPPLQTSKYIIKHENSVRVPRRQTCTIYQGRSTHSGRSGQGRTGILLDIDLRMRKLRCSLSWMSDERSSSLGQVSP